MKIFHNIPDNKNLFKNPVITIGNFDGIHLGHRKILQVLLDKAKEVNGDAVILTFSTHPKRVLNPDYPLKLITTTDEKINAIFKLGISNIILLNFTEEMSNMTASDFLNDILIKKLDIKELIIGYDHAFGKNREGDMGFLKESARAADIGITRVEELDILDKPCSSTWIRKEVELGHMEFTSQLLGRPYSLSGVVIHGHGRGKKFGYPTANITPDHPDKLIPPAGVYAVTTELTSAYVGKTHKHKGMMYIGTQPTFAEHETFLEIHIFDFEANLYDLDITVHFHKQIRKEIKFDSKDDLIIQLEKDEVLVKKALEHITI